MFFNSTQYLIFLPLVAIAYLAYRRPERRLLLLAASIYFYSVFSFKLLALLFWSSLLDFAMAQVIERNRGRPGIMKLALVTSIVGNLTPLFIFKYIDFFNHSLAALLGFHPWPILHLVLPMGISFYTFETISYTVDVYRGHLRAENSLLDYMLFILFFPHLVAGPILRARDILPQFREDHRPNADRILSGVQLVVWGLLKKVFLADPMGDFVAHVYDSPAVASFSGPALLLATYAFAIQIYCDFSAYSDIAIGSARILGFRFGKNFDAPYLAVTLRDFWRRWHISLSSWLRDYVYIPLGGGRISPARTYVNLIATMLIGGLWHGASFTFVVWGLIHGGYLAGERALGVDKLEARELPVWEKLVRGVLTFHLVCLAWIFFRASSFDQAWKVLRGILTWQDGVGIGLAPLGGLFLLIVGQIVKRRIDLEGWVLRFPTLSRWIMYACVALILTALAGGRSPEFIYFQF
jgi:D-alanyl-lipoteichoic acid acyltransferase DltB (MBOAT superfamily)